MRIVPDEEADQSMMAHEAEIIIPGSFVVLQGSEGDGMANTIDRPPQPLASATEDSDRVQATKEWRSLCREAEVQAQREWKVANEHCTALQRRGARPLSARSAASSVENATLWWQLDGKVALLRDLPRKLPSGAILRSAIGNLAPGSTVVGERIFYLDSASLDPLDISPSMTGSEDTSHAIYPKGSMGITVMLQVEHTGRPAYCVLSVDGYSYLTPGLPSLLVDPTVWIWRVTCPAGCFVREGLDLNSKHIETLPYGSLLRVTRKTINSMGLARLMVHAVVEGDPPKQVEGWSSEFLNPLSGQRGAVAQPVPFPVPALYRVTLDEGAVIRQGVELSSTQIGHAPHGAILSITARAFSEHPMDKCLERLQLAGGGGWISLRLNRPSPHDHCVVEYVGIDGSFEPNKPHLFHWEAQARVQEQLLASSSHSDASMEGQSPEHAGELSNRKAPISPTQSPSAGNSRSDQPHPICLVCLTEERNATIVHGETGHIACCLKCARILRARGDCCPVCRLPIESVIQHFFA